MPTAQCREPPGELTPEARTYARMIASLTEEVEAKWRVALQKVLFTDGDIVEAGEAAEEAEDEVS